MAQSVELPDDLIEALQSSANASGRSLTEQVMHYVALGRALERALPRDVVQAALDGRLAPESASARAPIDAALLDLVARLTQLGSDEEAFYAERRRHGLGSGLDENGNIVSQEEINARAEKSE